mgnify:FL=1
MTEFIELYSQTGMVGIVGAMCVYMVYNNIKTSHKQADDIGDLMIENKGQSETMENMEGMIIKLIERWNRSDETRDRRHENMLKEMNDISDVLMEVKGSVSRINGRS